jgi:hypothetical protein
MQFSRSLVVFVPRWYPWNVDKSLALTWLHEWMERGFKEVYQSWAISSSAIMRDLARV